MVRVLVAVLLMSAAPCSIRGCKSQPTDRAHIKSKGAGGTWDEWNIIHFCRDHHQMQHAFGWFRMCDKFPEVKEQLTSRGYKFVNEFGVMRLRRKKR